MAKGKKKPNVAGKLIGILFLCAAIVILFIIGIKAMETTKLNEQRDLLNQKLSELQTEQQRLSSTKAKLENEDYMQTYARGKYIISPEDEKIVSLTPTQEEGE